MPRKASALHHLRPTFAPSRALAAWDIDVRIEGRVLFRKRFSHAYMNMAGRQHDRNSSVAQASVKILGTVNAPYDANLSACQLAKAVSNLEAAQSVMGPAFSFFSEVPPDLQKAFVVEMGLPEAKVRGVAQYFQASCPFPLALAS